MIRFGRLLLFALLALWLPATMHCRLEAAGFFAPHDACAANESGDGTGCKDDACPTVEEALFKDSSPALVIAAPGEYPFPDSPALRFAPRPGVAEPALSAVPHAAPLALKVGWQFITRAAPPARAPARSS